MEKNELRFKGKKILQDISVKERLFIEARMQEELFNSKIWKDADVVGVTLSHTHEWSTEPIIEEGWRTGKKVVVPKCIPESRQMEFYHLEKYDQLERVYFGLREPKPEDSALVKKNDIDLLLVPGLLFNEKGYRIGYGGGYFDRFIEGFPGKTLMIASDRQEYSPLPFEEFDQRVEYVLTESGVRSTYHL